MTETQLVSQLGLKLMPLVKKRRSLCWPSRPNRQCIAYLLEDISVNTLSLSERFIKKGQSKTNSKH